MKYYLVPVLCLALAKLQAAQFIEMDSTNLVRSTLSSRHHNRIAVDGQRIKKIIYPEGDVLIRIEEESGQIFVQALIDYPPVTTVSIVTNEGLVQDLELSFADKASEILILRESSIVEEMCFEGCNSISCGEESDAIQKVIEDMLLGKVPEEYVPVEDRQICCQIRRDVTLNSTMRLVGPLYTVYVLMIENNYCRKVSIKESQINCLKGEWIFIEKNELDHGDKMLALIGVKTYEQ